VKYRDIYVSFAIFEMDTKYSVTLRHVSLFLRGMYKWIFLPLSHVSLFFRCTAFYTAPETCLPNTLMEQHKKKPQNLYRQELKVRALYETKESTIISMKLLRLLKDAIYRAWARWRGYRRSFDNAFDGV